MIDFRSKHAIVFTSFKSNNRKIAADASDMNFYNLQKIKNKYWNVLIILSALFISGLTTFAITKFYPGGKSISFSLTVKDTIGEMHLQDSDVKDICIYYATSNDPVYSERLRISKEQLLASDNSFFNQEHIVSLPANTIRIRVDLALSDALDIQDEVFPSFSAGINKIIFEDRIQVAQSCPYGAETDNVFTFEIAEDDVVSAGSSCRFQFLVPLFLITFLIVCIFIRLSKRYPRSILLLSFFLIILFPNFRFKTDKQSNQENRNLAPFPEEFHLKDISSWTSQFEAFYNDRFFGRGSLIRISDEVKTCFDDRGSERVLIGDDEWLFYHESLPEAKFSWNFNNEQMMKAGNYLNDLSQFAASKGKTFIYVICPDKFRIYGDKSNYYSQNAYLADNVVDRFVDYLRTRYDFPVIYMRQELLRKRQETAHDLYFKHDTHWTKEGAYYGFFLPVLDALSVDPVPVERWKPFLKKEGDLLSMLIHDRSCKKAFSPQKIYEPVYRKTAAPQAREDEHSPQQMIIETINPDGVQKKILVLRDSFATASADMFANTFQRSVFLWRYLLFSSDMEYIEQSDIIVLEQVERFVFQLGGLVFDKEELQ